MDMGEFGIDNELDANLVFAIGGLTRKHGVFTSIQILCMLAL